MSKIPSKPTFVFVPGAWHSASVWDKVAALLAQSGYASKAVTLPSTSGDPTATLLDDISAVRTAILSETDAGRDVVVACHSYGGLVGASALPRAGVVGLALVATGFCRSGMSFVDGGGGKPPPSWRADAASGLAVLVADPAELFYHDLPAGEARAWSAGLRSQSVRSLFEGGEHVCAGWRDVPVWYLITAEDRALPVEAQRWMAGDAREQGADVTVREVRSGHSPMLSKPEETAAFLIEAAKAVEA